MRRVFAYSFVLALVCALLTARAEAQTPITFQYFYDETGQLTRVVDSTGVVIEYVYDAVGNMLEIKRFSVPGGQLTIFSLTPQQGRVGSTVMIQGQGFSTTLAENGVRFNGTPAGVISATANSLSVLVPVGALTGPVSVTVGSTTAISPNSFTVLPALPLITSIAPRVFDSSRPPLGLQVRGSSLAGSSFAVVPAFVPSSVAFGTPQIDSTGTFAELPITIAANARGTFVLVATNNLGSSDAFPNAGNTLALINAQDEVDSDGDGFPDGLEELFGSDPSNPASVPDLRSAGELLSGAVAVANTFVTSPTPLTILSAAVAVANTFVTSPGPQELLGAAVAVANTFVTSSGPQELLSAAVAVSNTSVGGTSQQTIGPTVSILNSISSTTLTSQSTLSLPRGAAINPLIVDMQGLSIVLDQPRGGVALVEGRTITVHAVVVGPQPVERVDFFVNGRLFATDATLPYELTFMVPAGITSLTFGAAVRDVQGSEAEAVPVAVSVQPDPLTTITGRVVDAAGNAVRGAVVDLLSAGLQAEFFEFTQPLVTLPDLAGQTVDHVMRVTAVNVRNPTGVFGIDPFGSHLAPDYAARFSGWIAITTAGAHQFFLGAHEGARLKIAGVTIVDIATGTGEFQEGSAVINLVPGLAPIEITYYEGVGNAELQLSFAPPDGERRVVPPSSLVPAALPFVTATDASGTFTFMGVPTALDSVQVRAAATVNNQAVSASMSLIKSLPQAAVTTGDIVLTVQQQR